MSKFQEIKLKIARLAGLQKDLKKKRQVAQRALELTTVRKLEGRIQKTRTELRGLHSQLINMKILQSFQRAMDRAFKQRPTIRDVAQQIFKAQGLFLHDNNEVSGQGGKLVGRVEDLLVDNGELKIKYQPLQALDYIVVDIKI